jgi:hypothetical protein
MTIVTGGGILPFCTTRNLNAQLLSVFAEGHKLAICLRRKTLLAESKI